MIPLIAITISVYVLTGFVRIVAYFWSLFRDTNAHGKDVRLTIWFTKGVLIPIAIWLLFNFTLAPGHVATIEHIVVRKLSFGDLVWVLSWLTIPAALIASSFWAAMTLSWLVIHLVTHTESRNEIFGAGIFWGILLLPVAGAIMYFVGWYASGVAILILLAPLLRDLTALGPPRKLAPAYARAIERMKKGDFAAAEMEVIRQLERREEDFEGWMMLAQLYAKHFHDLPEAERTVREICRQTSTTRTEYCNALSQLGEWHLTFGNNAEAARRVWTEICSTYPHSEFADAARRRINQLTSAPRQESTL